MKNVTLTEMAERISDNTGFFVTDIKDVLKELNRQVDNVIDSNEKFTLGCISVWGEVIDDKYYQDPRDNSMKIFVPKHIHPRCKISETLKTKYRYKRYVRDGKTKKVWDKYSPRNRAEWEYIE